MKRIITIACLGLLASLASVARAQDMDMPANPVVTSLKGIHDITATNLLATARMLESELYAYRPTEEVRTAGEILAHVANAQYLICSAAAGKENPSSEDFEKKAGDKEAVIAALTAAFDYCAGVYASTSDADGATMRDFFTGPMAVSAILAFNSTHNYEHYGNLVTYMRENGLVPPSSQGM